jgi:hypothetical protein
MSNGFPARISQKFCDLRSDYIGLVNSQLARGIAQKVIDDIVSAMRSKFGAAGVLLSPVLVRRDLAEAINALLERLRALRPHQPLNKATLVRDLLHEGLAVAQARVEAEEETHRGRRPAEPPAHVPAIPAQQVSVAAIAPASSALPPSKPGRRGNALAVRR